MLRRPSLDVWKLYHAGKEIILWENFDLSHEILLKRVGPDLDIRSLFKEPLAQILLAKLIKMMICKVKKTFLCEFLKPPKIIEIFGAGGFPEVTGNPSDISRKVLSQI